MKFNDAMNKDTIRQAIQDALQKNDAEAFGAAMDDMLMQIAADVKADAEAQIEEMKQREDHSILSARGVRQLTHEEKQYYEKLGKAMRADDPKQALANLDVVMPETVISAVFDDLETNHPLLSKLKFTATGGAIKMLLNTNGDQRAVWGQLTDAIIKELMSGFKEVNSALLKLAAFLPVGNAMLDLGPIWLDSYVRKMLYEALSNGLEYGIVNGDGKESPIGMIREVGDGVSVVGGVYPEKSVIKVTNFQPDTMGNLLSLMAADPNGKQRALNNIILIVNPQDYFQKLMPATTVMAPDGTYRNDVLPYPMTIIQSAAVIRGRAVIGIANKYFAAAGMEIGGKIEYADQYKFLDDVRMYRIKLYANGFPMDNNAFLHLDISDLRNVYLKVENVTAPVMSADATLSALKIGALALTPAFDAAVETYAVDTTNATNVVMATPANADAEISVKVNGAPIDNGSAVTWESGANNVEITVVAEDGKTTKTYTVTVTKA